jgi:hypothetical protein
LLDKREAGLAKSLAMSDARSRNEVADAALWMRWHCLAHGRRTCSDREEGLPPAGQGGLAVLRQGCEHDAQARAAALGSAARLAYPQAQSQPLMDERTRGLDTQSAAPLGEPNRALGTASGARQRHWGPRTPCLAVPGAR